MAVILRNKNFIAAANFPLKVSSFSIIPCRNLVELPIQWKRPEKVPWYDKSKTGDGVLKLEVDMSKTPQFVEESKELAT